MGRDVWIIILLIRHFNKGGRIMMVKVEGVGALSNPCIAAD